MFLKSNPNKSKGFIKKSMAALIAFIGVFSTVIGLFQFFNVESLPTIEGDICLGVDNHISKGKIINFIYTLAHNSSGSLVNSSGNLVYFKNVRILYFCNDSQILSDVNISGLGEQQHYYGNSVTYVNMGSHFGFHLSEFLDTYTDKSVSRQLLSNYNIPFQESDIDIFDRMFSRFMSGYNVYFDFPCDEPTKNQYSFCEVTGYTDAFISDGIYIEGPYQIREFTDEEVFSYHILSTPLDSSIKQQVECMQKNWGSFKKFLFCPFL